MKIYRASLAAWAAVTLFVLMYAPVFSQEQLHDVHSASELSESVSSDDLQSLQAPSFSVAPGFYTEPITLEITSVHDGLEIRYTTDGSYPDENSTLYEGPIELGPRAGDPNTVSMIPTNAFDSSHPYNEHWQPPLGEVFKIHTIRARVFAEDADPGEITSGSFIIDEAGLERFSMPVISISTDADSLFSDDAGIYVPGSNPSNPNYNQRGREWERPAWIEFFEDDGSVAFSQQVGLRIHGGTSRSRPRKSLRIYARNDYGAPWINHQIFPDKPIGQFKRLLLRNSGNDWDGTVFRDGFMQALIRDLGVDMQHFRPAIVFINGEYWGIHNIRDRLDNRYIQTHYGLSDEEDYTMMEGNSELDRGNPDGVTHYNQMRSFLNNPGVSNPANYAELKTRMDTDNFADYFISQIYYRNTDWPGNNLQYWRSANSYDQDAPHGLDGRWRWMMFDTDFGFGLDFNYVTGHEEGPAHNTMAFALEENGPGWPNPPWSTFLLRKLVENDEFSRGFVNRTADLLNTVFREEYAVAVLDSVAEIFEPEMQEHIDRWRRPETVGIWLDDVEVMRQFALQRPEYMRNHVAGAFNLSGDLADVTLNVNDTEKGYIRINRVELRTGTPGLPADIYPWSGIYFSDNEVEISAVARSGFVFSEWEGSVSSDQETITLQPGGGLNLTAVFVPDDEVVDPQIEPFAVADGDFQFSGWSADSEPGTYPQHMKFFQTDVSDPGLDIPREDPWVMPYNLSSRSRINGLGDQGISFINTANPQDNGGGYLGSAVLALDTNGVTELYVGWRGGTLLPNSRVYNIRLQYRIGNTGAFEDVTDSSGEPVEYKRSELEGHSRYIGPVALPAAMLNRNYAELRWNYYYTGIRLDNESGQRSMLSLGDILVTSDPDGETASLTFEGLAPTAQADFIIPPFEVSARDETGALDTGFNGEIVLEVDQGPGVLLGPVETDAAGGRAVFTNIAFSEPGLYTLRASASDNGELDVLSDVVRVVDLYELVMPKVIQGAQPDNNDRIPLAYRLRIEGLKANSTYKYYNRVIDDTDGFDQDGGGNMIFVPVEGGDFVRTTGSPDFSQGAINNGYFELQTDEQGTFEGWFITEPTGNRRFEPGNQVRIRLLLNDGAGGTEIYHSIDTFSDIRVVEFGTEAGKATGLAAISEAVDRNFIVLYSDTEGAGRPVYATVAEHTGVGFDDRYAGFFREWTEGQSGRWAAVLPNELPDGIRRIEERSILDGFEVNSITSENGIWADGISTVNPFGGSESPIILDLVSAVPINDGNSETPAEFVLKQNYPNPFNPATSITYGLPEASHVKLEVYSVNGQLVTTLQNGMQSAGFHTVTFDSRNVSIASGVYLYRIEAGNHIQVKKMLLVK